jgi:polar amino acid transport system substrate-binding protein
MQPTFYLFATDNPVTHTVVRFCAPQNNIYPFFISENGSMTGINPDMMRQVFDETTLPDATLKYVRLPWKRCNADLEKGNVDMMIGGYDAERDDVVYPSKLGFNLSDTVISTADVCFSSVTGLQMEKVRRGMEEGIPFIVGIEAGFSKLHSRKIKPQWVVLFNPTEKYRMLEMGRVDAIVQVCAMDGDYPIETKAEVLGFNNVETLFPPYLSNSAYVVFSEKFANRHKELAKRIITLSLDIDKAQVYKRYQPKGNH